MKGKLPLFQVQMLVGVLVASAGLPCKVYGLSLSFPCYWKIYTQMYGKFCPLNGIWSSKRFQLEHWEFLLPLVYVEIDVWFHSHKLAELGRHLQGVTQEGPTSAQSSISCHGLSSAMSSMVLSISRMEGYSLSGQPAPGLMSPMLTWLAGLCCVSFKWYRTKFIWTDWSIAFVAWFCFFFLLLNYHLNMNLFSVISSFTNALPSTLRYATFFWAIFIISQM